VVAAIAVGVVSSVGAGPPGRRSSCRRATTCHHYFVTNHSDLHRDFVDGYLLQLRGWEGHRNHWSWDIMYTLIRDAPEVAWPILLEIIDRADDQQLGSFSAGHLEDFIAGHGRQFIDRIEVRAATDPKFRRSLLNVWQNSTPHDIWSRIVVLMDGRPERVEGIEVRPADRVELSVAGLPPDSPGDPEQDNTRR
jgi:hypothetical protein